MALRRTLPSLCLSTLLLTGALALAPGAGSVGSVTTAEAIPFGIGDWGNLNRRDFRVLGRNRVRTYRRPVEWDVIERTPDVYDFSGSDNYVRQAARRRIRILPILFGTPPYVAGNRLFPPRGPDALARFSRYVTAVVTRYGNSGTFWRENPGLPRMVMKDWQVWNEPHLRFFWGRRPNSQEYLNLAQIARRAARAVDPRARFMTASFTQGSTRYLGRLLRKRGVRRTFDSVALNLYHRYLRSPRHLVQQTLRFRRFLNRRGFRRKALHVTEFGWRSSRSRRSRRRQARQVRQSVQGLRRRARRLRLRSIMYFSYRDGRYTGGFRPSFRTGLRTRSNRRKPAFFTYMRLARRHGTR